ncbi:MAG TPA: hypothetical protein VGK19_24980 [Capsulimonadaceae bacterium]
MDDIVNTLGLIEKKIQGANVSLHYDEIQGQLHVTPPCAEPTSLKVTSLYRPSSDDVTRNAAPGSILILMAASEKAIRAASQHNHMVVPSGGFRIVVPGVALVEVPTALSPAKENRQVRLMGRTGLVAETLLLAGKRDWSVRELASASSVSPGLAQRVIHRLERESLLTSSGAGADKTRRVNNPAALAELWSEEEQTGKRALRGFLYGASNEAVVQRVLNLYPGSAVGGTFAANAYAHILTRAVLPIRFWITAPIQRELLDSNGFEETEEGANVEFLTSSSDSWNVHVKTEALPRVSGWRAWVEISREEGRVKELADALLTQLESTWYGRD